MLPVDYKKDMHFHQSSAAKTKKQAPVSNVRRFYWQNLLLHSTH